MVTNKKILYGIISLFLIFLIPMIFSLLWSGENTLTLYISFNETIGKNLSDSTESLTNATWQPTQPTWQPGLLGNSAHSNGSRYVNTTKQPFEHNQNFSISMWYKAGSETIGWLYGNANGTSPATSSSAGFRVEVDGSYYQIGNVLNSSGANQLNNAKFTDCFINSGKWINTILVYNGSGLWNLYCNGSLSIDSFEANMGNSTSTKFENDFFIFSQFGGTGMISNASIDDFFIFNHSVTPTEALLIFNDGIGRANGDEPLEVRLNSPIDFYNSSLLEVKFNISANSSVLNLEEISFQINSTTSFLTNQSKDISGNLSKEGTATFNLSLKDGQCYIWNGRVRTASSNASASSNRTICVDLFPRLEISAPTGTLSSKTTNVSIGLTDTNIDTCFFNVSRGASTEISNTLINTIWLTKEFVVSSDADYVIHVTCNDTRNQVNITRQSFSVDTSTTTETYSSSGGGGSSSITGCNIKLIRPTQNIRLIGRAGEKSDDIAISVQNFGTGTDVFEFELSEELEDRCTIEDKNLELLGSEIKENIFNCLYEETSYEGEIKITSSAPDCDSGLNVQVSSGFFGRLISWLNALVTGGKVNIFGWDAPAFFLFVIGIGILLLIGVIIKLGSKFGKW